MMAAGGQCCLARILPAHDACALPPKGILLAGHLLDIPKLLFILKQRTCRMLLAST